MTENGYGLVRAERGDPQVPGARVSSEYAGQGCVHRTALRGRALVIDRPAHQRMRKRQSAGADPDELDVLGRGQTADITVQCEAGRADDPQVVTLIGRGYQQSLPSVPSQATEASW